MAEDLFTPPLQLLDVSIRALSDAERFIRDCSDVRQPRTRDSMLRIIEDATSPEQERLAAKAFLIWAEAEGLIGK
jgi:hypothetical protein